MTALNCRSFMSHLDLPDIGAVGERRRPDSECFGTMGDVPRPRGILKKGRFSQDGPAVGSEGGGDDSTDTGNGRDSLSPPSSGAVEQRPAGVHGALLERNLAGADVSKGGSDDGASCPRYFGSQAVRESIAGHVGSVSKTSQEVLELRRQFTGLAAAYDDDTGSDSGSDAAKESLEEGRVHRGEQGALAMLSPVHPKMQDALGEKKTLRSFFSVRAAYWPGRLSRPYASRISACLSLRKARGGLFLPKPGPPPGSREATAFSVWRTRLVDALASPAVVDMTSARKPAAAARRERPLRR